MNMHLAYMRAVIEDTKINPVSLCSLGTNPSLRRVKQSKLSIQNKYGKKNR